MNRGCASLKLLGDGFDDEDDASAEAGGGGGGGKGSTWMLPGLAQGRLSCFGQLQVCKLARGALAAA